MCTWVIFWSYAVICSEMGLDHEICVLALGLEVLDRLSGLNGVIYPYMIACVYWQIMHWGTSGGTCSCWWKLQLLPSWH